jgi:hypothetical protein
MEPSLKMDIFLGTIFLTKPAPKIAFGSSQATVLFEVVSYLFRDSRKNLS